MLEEKGNTSVHWTGPGRAGGPCDANAARDTRPISSQFTPERRLNLNVAQTLLKYSTRLFAVLYLITSPSDGLMPAERKSTRLANRQAGPKVTIPDEYQSELWSSSSESEEVDDDEIVAVKKGSGAKRKPKSSSSTKQPPSKKPRGLKGLLKDVIDMPLDILYEVSAL